MSKCEKIVFTQVILLFLFICSLSLGSNHFYVPMILVFFNIICTYFTLREIKLLYLSRKKLLNEYILELDRKNNENLKNIIDNIEVLSNNQNKFNNKIYNKYEKTNEEIYKLNKKIINSIETASISVSENLSNIDLDIIKLDNTNKNLNKSIIGKLTELKKESINKSVILNNELKESIKENSSNIMDKLKEDSNNLIEKLNENSNSVVGELNKSSNNIVQSLNEGSNSILEKINENNNRREVILREQQDFWNKSEVDSKNNFKEIVNKINESIKENKNSSLNLSNILDNSVIRIEQNLNKSSDRFLEHSTKITSEIKSDLNNISSNIINLSDINNSNNEAILEKFTELKEESINKSITLNNELKESIEESSSNIIDKLKEDSNNLIEKLNENSNSVVGELNKSSNNIVQSLNEGSNSILEKINENNNRREVILREQQDFWNKSEVDSKNNFKEIVNKINESINENKNNLIKLAKILENNNNGNVKSKEDSVSKEDSLGTKYYDDNGRIKEYIDKDGVVTKFKYENNELKYIDTFKKNKIVTRNVVKNGKIIKGASYIDGHVSEEYFYNLNGQLIMCNKYKNGKKETINYDSITGKKVN